MCVNMAMVERIPALYSRHVHEREGGRIRLTATGDCTPPPPSSHHPLPLSDSHYQSGVRTFGFPRWSSWDTVWTVAAGYRELETVTASAGRKEKLCRLCIMGDSISAGAVMQ